MTLRRIAAAAVVGLGVTVAIVVFVVTRGSHRPTLADALRPRAVTAPRQRISPTLTLRKVSRDPYRNPQSNHEAAVEPHLTSSGRTIVVAYQVARGREAAANDIGFATSTDGGASWTSGFLPALTRWTSPPAPFRWATDPVVARDTTHRTWLIGAMVGGADSQPTAALVVSRSRDGRTWTPPKRLVTASFLPLFDKPWVACDNSPSSRYRGRCYFAYTDDRFNRVSVRHSADGGRNWSAASSAGPPERAFAENEPIGVELSLRRDGVVQAFYMSGPRLLTSTSQDGGVTFSRASLVSKVRVPDPHRLQQPYSLRGPGFETVAIDSDNAIYIAWPDCVAPGCPAIEILLSRSSDGRHWSEPRVVVRAARGIYQLMPTLAVDGRPCARSRLALVYYSLAEAKATFVARLAVSPDGGRRWQTTDLTPPARLRWVPTVGRPPTPFVGDYFGLTFTDRGEIVAAVTLTLPPRGRFRQGVYIAEERRRHECR